MFGKCKYIVFIDLTHANCILITTPMFHSVKAISALYKIRCMYVGDGVLLMFLRTITQYISHSFILHHTSTNRFLVFS